MTDTPADEVLCWADVQTPTFESEAPPRSAYLTDAFAMSVALPDTHTEWWVRDTEQPHLHLRLRGTSKRYYFRAKALDEWEKPRKEPIGLVGEISCSDARLKASELSRLRHLGVTLPSETGLAPISVADVWALLRRGHSTLARALGFGWLALGILVVFAASHSNPSPSRDPASIQVADEVSSAPIRTAYVEPLETEERSAPDGPVVNRIYRGQRLDIFAVEGDWARVTAPNFDPRWVRLSHLTDTMPAEGDRSATASDPRLAALPGVGDYGHTEADVAALRAGALQLLSSGQCTRIDDANRSVNIAGVYFINCGESSNRFFRMEDGEPRFCGRSANAC